MVDHIFDASDRRSRVDISVGVGRRRRWMAQEKGRVVAESYAPGAIVSEVARRNEMSPQHLFGWRKAAREGRLALPADEAPLFVPIVVASQKTGVSPKSAAPSITIEIAGIVVRAERGVDAGWLAEVLRAVKAMT